MRRTVSLIVAVSNNGVIGKDNTIPWRLPADMVYFKNTTMGHPVIMGRKTYESIPPKFRPLDGRPNIILTRREESFEGCHVANNLDRAITLAATLTGGEEIFLAGGVAVYDEGLKIADKLYVTRVLADVEGDAFFPQWNESEWRLLSQECQEANEKNAHPLCWEVYERVR